MAHIYISIGSNIDPARHVRAAVAALREQFTDVTLSSVYESKAVGFDGDNFYNLVTAAKTGQAVHEVARILRQIEDRFGHDRRGPRFSSRTVDLDLLLYDDRVLNEVGLVLPREEIVKNAFVLQPLAEIAPQVVHPLLKKNYAELWCEFDKSKQSLWPVELEFS
ncbi:MAG: 2-amino-4-hydroxy-6-hydroxymethyldihydropteridine diphosphokinase [Gammaproteobacteria bacterium]|nr:2-amino-4-hydroxy-6-hydroxymethyldihydropteridine diphosphokinase [Gammaproteobacteria bacterium]